MSSVLTARIWRSGPSALFFGFILVVGLLPWLGISQIQLFYVIAAFGVCAIVAMGVVFRRTDRVKAKYNALFLDYVADPSPATSLMDSLERAGVAQKDIKSLKLMTADLEHGSRYVEEKFRDFLDRYRDVQIDVLGQACREIPQSGRVRYFNATQKLVEHENLVETRDGSFLLWYEPYHDVQDGVDVMPQGAYLLRLDQEMAETLLKRFEALKDQRKVSSVEGGPYTRESRP